MSFFIRGKQPNGSLLGKRGRKQKTNKKPKKEKPSLNEEIESSDEDLVDKNDEPVSSSEDENETAQEKKIRLAKTYLEEIEREERRRLENVEDSALTDVIAKRLKEDHLKQTGRLKTQVADTYTEADVDNMVILRCKNHRDSITCICISSDDKYVYSGSKDATVVKWCLQTGKRLGSITRKKPKDNVPGHCRSILSMAITTDSNFLAIGDESPDIHIWNPDTLSHINTLKGHKKAVTGLVFKKETHTLYSCSKDKLVRVWSLDEMAYVETLFGHQDSITSIDALMRERAVTSGGRDATLRLWKIAEESQLVFNGHNGSIDNVRFINEDDFVSGGDDGQVCVWSTAKKKPLCSVKEAHGSNPTNQQPYWISTVASLQYSDLIASGSQDGFIKLWKLSNGYRSISPLFTIPVTGFVNSIVFTSDGSKLIAAVGQEHRFGRWDVIKSAKNCVIIVPLKRSE